MLILEIYTQKYIKLYTIDMDKNNGISFCKEDHIMINKSPTIKEYKQALTELMQLYTPMSKEELSPIIDYSMNKRYYQSQAIVSNSYTNKESNLTLLQLADYINSRQPIVTAHGTMFMKHADCPNPMSAVIQLFLDKRSQDKKMMFKFPKGSEDYEKYNLLQSLDKIDCNGIYGCIGLYTSLLFDINGSSSITSQGRALISSASMMFEGFLADNVKFGSLNEVLTFINNIHKENRKSKYKDNDWLDHNTTVENCFAKIINECGYQWIPNEDEMDVIWRVINNLSQTDLERVYYKNNLYEFLSNEPVKNCIRNLMSNLNEPYLDALSPADYMRPILEDFAYLLKEYVYYDKMIIDRIDRNSHMRKSVIAISDTDSCILSLDAWYRFVLEVIKDTPLKITKYDPISLVKIIKMDEFGDPVHMSDLSPIDYELKEEEYDFVHDEISFKHRMIHPLIYYPQDYLRFSIISVMSFVIDILINDYMLQFTKNNHSWAPDKPCKILMKTEFQITRMLLTSVKKSYSSMIAVQEGHQIPKEEQLDIKGIASMAKSSMSESTRSELKKILYEDIMTAPVIDQFKIIENMAILERKIINSIQSGSKEYYKPVTVTSIDNYENPMRIQGIKASVVWNSIKTDDLPAINLDERNPVDIAKVIITGKSIEKLKDWPEVYEKAEKLLETPEFGRGVNKKGVMSLGEIDSIAIPLDVEVPDWVSAVIDYNTLVNDNISGFPYQSAGIVKLSDDTNYSNILQV